MKASAECKRRGLDDSSARRREVLGSVLYDIRFPAMNVQDFADHVALSGMLVSSFKTLSETIIKKKSLRHVKNVHSPDQLV